MNLSSNFLFLKLIKFYVNLFYNLLILGQKSILPTDERWKWCAGAKYRGG